MQAKLPRHDKECTLHAVDIKLRTIIKKSIIVSHCGETESLAGFETVNFFLGTVISTFLCIQKFAFYKYGKNIATD